MSHSASQRYMDIRNFGARAGGSPCTDAIQAAVAACAAQGGGTVYVPAGDFLTGPLTLASHTTLYLESGATLRFCNQPKDFPIIDDQWEGHDCRVYAPLLYGRDLEDVAVMGRGTIDGQGAPWWKLYRDKMLLYPRPRMIVFSRCRDVRIEGVRLIDSPNWTVNPVECEHVSIMDLHIENPADAPTTDGIDPCSCRDVMIRGCRISVGDDCIAIKSGREECPRRIPCEDIVVTGCIMLHGHGGVVIGSEMSGDIRRVVVGDCIFRDTDRGIRIKSRRGRGGVVEHILVSNVLMTNVLCPFIINCFYFCGPHGHDPFIADKQPRPVTGGTPVVRDINIRNVTAIGVRICAGFLYGLPERPAESIHFSDCVVKMAPDGPAGLPDMLDGLHPVARRGFFCGNIRQATFSHMELMGYEGPAYTLHRTKGIQMDNCPGVQENRCPDYVTE